MTAISLSSPTQCMARLTHLAGTLLYKTLIHLGHPSDSIAVHHLSKGTSIHTPAERERMDAYGMDRTIVLDQGSRPGPALTKGKVLVIDHHFSSEVSLVLGISNRARLGRFAEPAFPEIAVW